MKQRNIILNFSLIAMAFILILVCSCTTKDDILPDYASKIVGTYNGTITLVGTGTLSSSSILSKSSEQLVDLKIEIGSESFNLDGISVSISTGDSISSGDIYNLKFTDSSGSFTGKVEGNRFTWTLNAENIRETFSGTK